MLQKLSEFRAQKTRLASVIMIIRYIKIVMVMFMRIIRSIKIVMVMLSAASLP